MNKNKRWYYGKLKGDKMENFKINKCKSTHGRFDLDSGNVIIEMDVELDTKEIKKNIAIKVEKLMGQALSLLEMLEKLVYLHQCEMEGLKLPSQSEWEQAVHEAEEIIIKAKDKN